MYILQMKKIQPGDSQQERASNTVTLENPKSWRRDAAERPDKPPPMTTIRSVSGMEKDRFTRVKNTIAIKFEYMRPSKSQEVMK
jgi:hypothetical protein